MRVTYYLAAAALIAAGPALAQNTADTNGAVAEYPSENVAAADTAADSNLVVDANAAGMDMDAIAVEEDAAPAPAPERKRGFPWGVLGLLGLAGLIGRKR